MAKKKSTDAAATTSDNQGETVTGYFRKVFDENPSWIDTRSNDQLYARWIQDHPGEKEVPERVRQNLSNLKSVLRKQSRKKRGRPKKSSQPVQDNGAPATSAVAAEPVVAPRKSVKGLDALEEQIDDCLSFAKSLDREGLANIIILLRRARNEVVWKMGQTGER